MHQNPDDVTSSGNGFGQQVSKMSNVKDENKMVRTNTSFHYFGYLIVMIGGFACGCMFLARISVSVAMLTMVNHTALYEYEHPNSSVEEFFAPDYIEVGEFMWTNEIQQAINTGYMAAYTIPQFYTSRLAHKIGLHLAIPISLLICGLSCSLTPIVAYFGWVPVLCLRLLNGFGASAILPSMIAAVELWMPYEKSALGVAMFQFISMQIYAVGPLISGYLAAIHWKWALYIPALVTIFASLVWWLLAANSPEESRFMSEKELATVKAGKSGKKDTDQEKRPLLPWYFMFKIKSFYAISITWALYCSTSGGLLYLLPAYFNKVMKLSVNENGLYLSIVTVGCMFSMLWSNPVTTFLQKKFGLSLSSARTLVYFISQFGAISTYVYLAMTHKHQVLVLTINRFILTNYDTVATATIMSQFGQEGLSSQVFSMMNSIGNFATLVVCWAVGRFLDHTGESIECWSGVFITMAIMNVISFLIYALFIRSEPISCYKESSDRKQELK